MCLRFLTSLIVLILVGLLTAAPTHAHDQVAWATGGTPAISVPPSQRLAGLQMFYQDFNRCSAAALTILLSYYDDNWTGSYTATINGLNPHSEDVSVRLDEMVTYVETFGLQGVERTGGTIDLLKILVANGFPVLVENIYYEGSDPMRDWMSHNRVVMGYDDAQGVLLTFDSLLGAGENQQGRAIPYADFDERWRPFNRDYLVIYKPGAEVLLSALMGDQWDETLNAEWTLHQAEGERDTYRDSFAPFNMGEALVRLGRYEEAAAAFDEARAIGLPWRAFWYQFGAFEAYLQVGRYDDVIKLARDVIAATPGVEETYYYIARAYRAQGDVQRAEANLEVAIMRNKNFTAAIDLLAELRGEATAEG